MACRLAQTLGRSKTSSASSKRAPAALLMSSVAPRLNEQAARPSAGSSPSVLLYRSRGVFCCGSVPRRWRSGHLGAEANPAFAKLEVPCALTNGEVNGYQGTAESGKASHPARQRPPREARREAPASRRSRATEGASGSKTGVRRNWQVGHHLSRFFPPRAGTHVHAVARQERPNPSLKRAETGMALGPRSG